MNKIILEDELVTRLKKTEVEKPAEYKDKIVILASGRLAVEKAQDVLIKAVKYSKYKDKIQLMFAGQGPLENKFKKMSKKLPNYPSFKIYPREEMNKVYNMCDIYVHTATMELEGIACIEAISVGKLVLVSDSKKSATRYFAVDPKCIFKSYNAKDLARVIDYFIEHEDEKKEIEKKYLETAHLYNQEKCMDRMLDMMTEIHNNKKEQNK